MRFLPHDKKICAARQQRKRIKKIANKLGVTTEQWVVYETTL